LTPEVTRLCLCWEDWRAELAPDIGGSVLSLSLAGHAILRPTSSEAFAQGNVRHTACFPLLPYANRIAHGRFHWQGIDHSLDENFPASVHPLHGVGWQRPWQIVCADAHSCELQFQHRPIGKESRGWPFAFDAAQRISLRESGLIIELSIVNVDELPAPLGLGLHPLFPRRGSEQRLTFVSGGAWQNGTDMLPSGVVSGGLWDHSRGQSIGAQPLDNDFFGWPGRARIESQAAPTILITASRAFSSLRVFTPAAEEFFGVEPVSHLTDAINRSATGAGMLRAEPGAALAGTVSIGVEPQQ
jgi:aldose 1-epimerase